MAIEKSKMYGEQSLSPITRLIFGNVYEPEQVKGQGAFKYRITAALRPTGALFQGLKNQMDRLVKINFGDDTSDLELPLVPCSELKAFKTRPEYEGLWVLKATANPEFPPKIYDASGLLNINPGLIYRGCYVRMSVNPFAYDNMSKGVSFGLQGISFVKDGPRIGAGIDPQQQFATTPVSQDELEWSIQGSDVDSEDVPF